MYSILVVNHQDPMYSTRKKYAENVRSDPRVTLHDMSSLKQVADSDLIIVVLGN